MEEEENSGRQGREVSMTQGTPKLYITYANRKHVEKEVRA